MGNRTIERRMARTLYDEFTRKWGRATRLAGKAGQPGFRKPSFKQWHDMHMRDQQMMRESTPVDVQEYLGRDPWETPPIVESNDSFPGSAFVPLEGGVNGRRTR